MLKTILYLIGAAIIVLVAFATALSILNNGFLATFHTIFTYVNP